MMELEMNLKRFEMETRTIAKTLEMRRRYEEEVEEANPESKESMLTLPIRVFEKMVRTRATLSAFLTW